MPRGAVLDGSLTQSLRCTYDGWSTREDLSNAHVGLQIHGGACSPSQAAAGLGGGGDRDGLGHAHGVHMLPAWWQGQGHIRCVDHMYLSICVRPAGVTLRGRDEASVRGREAAVREGHRWCEGHAPTRRYHLHIGLLGQNLVLFASAGSRPVTCSIVI